MSKKTLAALLLCSLLVGAPAAAAPLKTPAPAPVNIRIWIGGETLSSPTPPMLVKGAAMVPLRQVAEALGAQVAWSKDRNNRQTVTVTRGGRSAAMTVGSSTLRTAGRTVKLIAGPVMKDGVTMVPLRAVSESLGSAVAWDGLNRIVRIDDPGELPVIGTAEQLQQLLKKSQNAYGSNFIANERTDAVPAVDQAKSNDSAAADGAASGGDYSRTNVQVEGVDEADWAKTDGRFVYQLSGNRVQIADIANPSEPKLAATIDYTAESGFYPREMYADGERLIVIGQQNSGLPMPIDPGIGGPAGAAAETGSSAAFGSGIDRWPAEPMRTTVKTLIYDVSEDGQPKLARETELEGSYVSSRKIAGALYMVANKYTDVYRIMESGKSETTEAATAFQPVYRDSANSSGLKRLPLDAIRYFPASPDTSMMVIGALDLDRPDREMQVSGYLGSGQTVYASPKNLYVAVGKYIPSGAAYRQETQVYKFRMDRGSVAYEGEGLVPGSILNQFAMDEYDGFFRIATTKGDMWATGAARSTNNLYVMDEEMAVTGKLENLAPGERIYSTRFMGGRAYMVTFRNVDPLFAIDLRDPAKPAVLGQLKIPGYSDYLHPYDENYVIGFGKETVELPSKGMGPNETTAYYQGMKIALFDVSDVSSPKQKFKEVIGDRGTDSELLYDPKALLFSKSKGLMAFPVEVREIRDKNQKPASGGFPAYGEFTYQGAYVYRIDPQKGFALQGRITHLTAEDMAASGQYGYDYTKAVRRILYAGDTLFTLSERMLKANDMNTLADQGSLTYPAPPQPAELYAR
ncbi:MAG TPA: beta-propeller domain-containing protein [Paenibacillus sp.]|uniref:beta-propeller domain-containing protein n=2 Tax=Paenibacillus TaxID=44249 RepID=UPI002C353933|nr:beta-propeller domain-containing protein [Paenibacillus sp.]HUC93815.1 beta-propeller domain-containing protein [Paenibacillus sp.]